MSVRRFTGFLILFLAATAVVAVALTQGPVLLSGQSLWNIAVAFAAGVCFFVLFLYILADQVLLRDPLRMLQDPMQVALEFNRRTLGLSDEGTLASAIGAMLAEWLNIHRSGWVLLKPRDNALVAKPVAGKGNLPEIPLELARNNWLIQELSQRRAPVPHFELEASAMPEVEKEWFKQLGVAVYAPIFEAGILTAMLVIGPKDGNRRLGREDLELISLIAALATPSLKSARLLTELRQLNETITQLNEKLEARAAATPDAASRSEFLAITSHELRTPITQLLGYADLMGTMVRENTLDRVTAAQVTESIVRACGRLNEVISQMLDMAQIDANALELKLSTTNLDHILRQAFGPYLPALRERKLALTVNGLKALPPLVGDEQRLAQAFSQLVSNAIKYTPDGGRIDVTVRVLPQDEKQPARLLITFADSGIGIDPRQHRLIFEKFYRVGSSAQHSTSMTKFMGAGPGLGLPIAKGIIERHGGRIWVESTGQDMKKFPGSRFHVVLPFRPPGLDSNAVLVSAEDIARLRRAERLD